MPRSAPRDPRLGQLRLGKRHVDFLPLRCKDSRSRVKTILTQANSWWLMLPKNSLRTDGARPGVARRGVSNPVAVSTARIPRRRGSTSAPKLSPETTPLTTTAERYAVTLIPSSRVHAPGATLTAVKGPTRSGALRRCRISCAWWLRLWRPPWQRMPSRAGVAGLCWAAVDSVGSPKVIHRSALPN